MSCESDKRHVVEASCARGTAGIICGVINTPDEKRQMAEWLAAKIDGCTELNGRQCTDSRFCEIAAAYFNLLDSDTTR